MGVAKVGQRKRELGQHLPTTKSGGILRLCDRLNRHGDALAEDMEGSVVGKIGERSLKGVGLETDKDCLAF